VVETVDSIEMKVDIRHPMNTAVVHQDMVSVLSVLFSAVCSFSGKIESETEKN